MPLAYVSKKSAYFSAYAFSFAFLKPSLYRIHDLNKTENKVYIDQEISLTCIVGLEVFFSWLRLEINQSHTGPHGCIHIQKQPCCSFF